jgi:allantoinase
MERSDRVKIIHNPADATVFAPDLDLAYDGHREPWHLPNGKKLAVSLLLHAPRYQDDVPSGAIKPLAMQGGVGRDTSEPRHGQVARLSQWDFGLTVGIWRLLDIARVAGMPTAVALDAEGVEATPRLAADIADRADEIVVRGRAANIIIGTGMSAEEEREYIVRARHAVESASGRACVGWFGPERGQTAATPALLRETGFRWFGDWPVDERPVILGGAASGLVAVSHQLEAEDMFSLYTRGLSFLEYERLLDDTVAQLLADAKVVGARHLGLSWFGWVLGQAAFAGVAERFLRRLAAHPDILLATPGDIALLSR